MPKKSSIDRDGRVPSITMLTTAGLALCAMVRNVVASSAPVSGALLVAGTLSVPANDAGARSSRDGDHHADHE